MARTDLWTREQMILVLNLYMKPIENATLVTPKKYHINPQFLEWHRDCIFNK